MNQADRDIFKAAKERFLTIEKLHRETERDAKALSHLIGSIAQHDSYTSVNVGGWNHSVKETAEEILAMPEMAEALYPAMIVEKDGSLTPLRKF